MTDHNDGTQGHDRLMNAIYRNQRYIYDATRKYYLLGRDRLIDELDVPAGGTVLEVACGTGRNLIRAARRFPQAQLYGFDISTEMLATARGNIARAGLADRITLAQGDATDFDGRAAFGRDGFDRVMISYSLSMIPDWRAALDCAYGQTAPGGQLAVVDFGTQTGLPGWFGAGLQRWLGLFHVTPRADLQHAMHDLADAQGATAEMGPILRDYAVAGRIHRPV
jgi:S-adenosylmethionine-diacylgycerolhomoserine-N-methlytransferase